MIYFLHYINITAQIYKLSFILILHLILISILLDFVHNFKIKSFIHV